MKNATFRKLLTPTNLALGDIEKQMLKPQFNNFEKEDLVLVEGEEFFLR